MSPLLQHLTNWKPFTAIVVGDFMLDQLVYGNADRLSPEAPVPVLHAQRTEDRPGGAANVCLDLIAMRGRVFAVGVTGDDREADLLRSALAAASVDAEGLVTDPARPTTVKRSLIGLAQHRHPQKMFRVDHESREPLPRAAVSQAVAHVERLLPSADVVCIEDYNKGVCSPELCAAVIAAAKRAGVPVLVDPAAIEDYARYRGASAITPNRTEATGATGDRLPPEASPEQFAPIARQLLNDLDLEASIVTLDKHGCLLLERNGSPTVVPTFARQVYDVTGAGDMVLAALAAARANGIGWHDAVRFANAAAGLEVEVFGVVPMPIERIHRECLMRERPESGSSGKVRTLEQAVIEAAALRSEGRKIVFANGCFDVLHTGHTTMLRRAAELGDFLVVAVNSDRSVRRLKAHKDPLRPVNSQHDRAAVLAELGCVGAVVIFDEDTADRAILAIKPDLVVKGAEYTAAQVPEAPTVASYGGRLVLLDMVSGRSTTATIARIREADAANPSATAQ
ncbi:MAG: bifunctional heptose 7-phosphate kinase/heptose 1-phosphate adenyltransferase [Phycisphaerales bacterium]|nr:bifunctional heptose 7-phosphate kinase/heptose 1-phosphate adenyltransferase [Phycisphaerales bacterium]